MNNMNSVVVINTSFSEYHESCAKTMKNKGHEF